MKNRLIEICEQVAEDVENDAKEFDGKPFDGKTVAAYFGNHGAAIKALADVLKKLIEEDETKAKNIYISANSPFAAPTPVSQNQVK